MDMADIEMADCLTTDTTAGFICIYFNDGALIGRPVQPTESPSSAVLQTHLKYSGVVQDSSSCPQDRTTSDP